MHAQLLSCVRPFVTPMDCSLPGSSVHGISQANILEWDACVDPESVIQGEEVQQAAQFLEIAVVNAAVKITL